MFQLDRFIDDCRAARNDQLAVRDLVARAVADPRSLVGALGEPQRAGVQALYRSDELTVLNLVWGPRMMVMPHNHEMWAVIGIYTGREDNILWHRTPEKVEAFSAKALFEGDVAVLPADVIHSVTNPLPRFTGGIHIYGGDFFDTARSQWNPETLEEEPSNGATIRDMFEKENARRRCV